MKVHGFAVVIAAVACALLPSAAAAQTGSRQSAELSFLETEPGVPTGFTLEIDYVNPSDPSGKPPAVRKVVQQFAEGTRIDTSIPERCGASDPELILLGAEACPAASRVGSGTVITDTGLPEPNRFLVVDTVLLNNTDELILVNTERGTGGRVVTRAAVEKDRIVTELPPLPGTPPDGAAIDVVDFRIDEISRVVEGQERGYVTTPESCPAGGWLNAITFTYADGVSQTTSNRSPCSPTTVVGGAPGLGTPPPSSSPPPRGSTQPRGGRSRARRCAKKKAAAAGKRKAKRCKRKRGGRKR